MQARYAMGFLAVTVAAATFALLGWAIDELSIFQGWERLTLAVVGTSLVGGVVLLARRESQREQASLRLANAELEEAILARTEDLSREVERRAGAEEALRAAETRFRDIAETMNEWVWETDADLTLTYVSRRLVEELGVGPERLLGRPAQEVFHDPLEEAGGSFHAAYFAARRPFSDVALRLQLDDVTHHVSLSGRPTFDGAGGFRGFRGTGTTITDRVLGRQAAERFSRRHELVLSIIGEGVFGFDRDGRLTFANPAMIEMLGWPMNELLEQPIHRTFCRAPDGDIESPDSCHLYGCLKRTGVQRVRDRRLMRKDGSYLPVDYVAMPVSEDGVVTGAIVAFHAATERQRAEQALRRAKEQAERATQAKSEFLAAMSHSFRTPLNAIIGFADVILAELLGPLGNERYREYVTDIRRSAQHLTDMIADIVDLSKVESGRLDLIEQPVDIATLIGEALVMVRQEAAKGGCSISNNVPGNLPLVRADSRRLKQAFLNLLSNAVKFTPPGGQVRISAEVTGEGALRVCVSDTGVGIAEEDLARVTEAFVQGNIAVSRKYEGAGLGLPLAKRLVERHGGRLEIDSVLHEGTTVTVWLPPTRLVTSDEAALTA